MCINVGGIDKHNLKQHSTLCDALGNMGKKFGTKCDCQKSVTAPIYKKQGDNYYCGISSVFLPQVI